MLNSNLRESPLKAREQGSQPLHLFLFSSFDPLHPHAISTKGQPQHNEGDNPSVEEFDVVPLPQLNREVSYQLRENSTILFSDLRYNPLASPPDIQKAIQHGLAQRICKPPLKWDPAEKRCECCGLPVINSQYDICDPSEHFQHIGTAFPMFFTFMKQCILFLAVLFVGSSIPSFILNKVKVMSF